MDPLTKLEIDPGGRYDISADEMRKILASAPDSTFTFVYNDETGKIEARKSLIASDPSSACSPS